MQPTIFIQLAAYRDPELLPTIHSALENAQYPARLRFGVCWQYMPGLDEYLLFPSEINEQVKLIAIPADQCKGVCWARNIAQSLYDDEDYVLSVDSHTRFVKNWDVKIIDELHRCPSKKPILSTYPASFKAAANLENTDIVQLSLGAIVDGSVRLEGRIVKGIKNETQPIPSMVSACGFYFCHGAVNREIPIDPLFYFNQEEFVHSLKLWTHGFDCYTPTQHFVLHQYGAEKSVFDRAIHWGDDKAWPHLNERAQIRLHSLIGGRYDPAPSDFPIHRYPLGKARLMSAFFTQLGLEYVMGQLRFSNPNSHSPSKEQR